MPTMSTYLKLALTFVVSIPLKDVLEAVVNPMMGVGCNPNTPTVVEGARNCLYIQQAMTWFLGFVLVGMLVTALSRGVSIGGVRR
ncbi:hypothetical protein C5B91_20145 [Haloferax sp. Atlit-10N]|uniref:hypothetical protein n=1 Tax=unclassified Haloferax TaxID=2625095 RepID=UPI000E2308B3|nr:MULTISPECIES: hypothetical protein [unclassified Haloferax]RDZ39406.1 hypothetical protein C5B87_19405 [Haloferax sp. Atlit-16N]RDZ53921.1 hypothetical protein C5B91_20145 [Haloferax sp. Atlit-10N]